VSLDAALVERARALGSRRRAVLGICGAPGAGKSTLAADLVARLEPIAVVVPMDGFHLSQEDLARLGLAGRKGAPETFDVAGYVSLLRRLRSETRRTVHAPAFDRSQESVVEGAVAVTPEHRVVVTEGNYLLHDAPGWADVAPLLDEVWFVTTDDAVRVPRLVQRHVAHGRTPEQARRWVDEVDEENARLVGRTRAGADVVVQVD
jgi:pantothenate kinase